MKKLFAIALLSFASSAFAQNMIEWDGKYQLKLSDFKSPATQIGNVSMYSIQSNAVIDYAVQMSNYEFMFTKNFNSKINCSIKREGALLIATDTAMAMQLLSFAQYDFDLAELYARKLRKRFYEEKGAFSNISYFQPLYDEVYAEYVKRHGLAGKETDIGRDSEKLKQLHTAVLQEIDELPDFCKTCKPRKKKA